MVEPSERVTVLPAMLATVGVIAEPTVYEYVAAPFVNTSPFDKVIVKLLEPPVNVSPLARVTPVLLSVATLLLTALPLVYEPVIGDVTVLPSLNVTVYVLLELAIWEPSVYVTAVPLLLLIAVGKVLPPA